MGLVTCEKCKKIYDYDKYNGICPKCARYNRENTAASEHQEFHNKYDGGYSHNAQDDHHSYHQKYDEIKNPHEKLVAKIDLKSKKVLGIFIALVFFMCLLPFFGPFLFVVAIWIILVVMKGKKKK